MMKYRRIYCPRAFGAGYRRLLESLMDLFTYREHPIKDCDIPPEDNTPECDGYGTYVWISYADDWSRCVIYNYCETDDLKTPDFAKLFSFLTKNSACWKGSFYGDGVMRQHFLLSNGKDIFITHKNMSENFKIVDNNGRQVVL